MGRGRCIGALEEAWEGEGGGGCWFGGFALEGDTVLPISPACTRLQALYMVSLTSLLDPHATDHPSTDPPHCRCPRPLDKAAWRDYPG
jgi:hypothetical protein